jgi:hypothetical protein
MGFGVRNVSFEEIRREELRWGASLHGLALDVSRDQHLLEVEPLYFPKS